MVDKMSKGLQEKNREQKMSFRKTFQTQIEKKKKQKLQKSESRVMIITEENFIVIMIVEKKVNVVLPPGAVELPLPGRCWASPGAAAPPLGVLWNLNISRHL